jgi:hypothetical protein
MLFVSKIEKVKFKAMMFKRLNNYSYVKYLVSLDSRWRPFFLIWLIQVISYKRERERERERKRHRESERETISLYPKWRPLTLSCIFF